MEVCNVLPSSKHSAPTTPMSPTCKIKSADDGTKAQVLSFVASMLFQKASHIARHAFRTQVHFGRPWKQSNYSKTTTMDGYKSTRKRLRAHIDISPEVSVLLQVATYLDKSTNWQPTLGNYTGS